MRLRLRGFALVCCLAVGCRTNSAPPDAHADEIAAPTTTETSVARLRPAGGVEIGDITYVPGNVTSDPVVEAAILREFPDYQYCGGDPEGAVRYLYNRVDLNSDGVPETLVYLVGRETCGSGGCTVLVFRSSEEGLVPLTRLRLVQPPVVVASQTSHGWRDLVTYVAGGGAKGAYHLLRHTGEAYPPNPSVAPALPAGSTISGEAYFGEEVSVATTAPVLRSQACPDSATGLFATEQIGPLRIGLKGDRVIELLGSPKSKGAPVRSEVDGLDHQTWRYPARGVTLDMVFAADEESPAIAGLRIGPASALRTQRDIGIGSSYADVERAYAKEKDDATSQPPFTLVAGSPYEGIVFSFENGRVTQVFLGASAE
jgi:hypothetical protein